MVTAYEVDETEQPTGRETPPEPFSLVDGNKEELVSRLKRRIEELESDDAIPEIGQIEVMLQEALKHQERVVVGA
jgi:hypothetical protein